jgi:hypothetical protein
MSEQGFRGIPGVPDGWELIGIGYPCEGDYYLDSNLNLNKHEIRIVGARPIVRKIETPKRYRPFANAEEFKPHRDRWWRFKDVPDQFHPPSSYSDSFHSEHRWVHSFVEKIFDDGSPFGVEVAE